MNRIENFSNYKSLFEKKKWIKDLFCKSLYFKCYINIRPYDQILFKIIKIEFHSFYNRFLSIVSYLHIIPLVSDVIRISIIVLKEKCSVYFLETIRNKWSMLKSIEILIQVFDIFQYSQTNNIQFLPGQNFFAVNLNIKTFFS